MRLVFIGASQFGLRALERVLDTPECDVVGILTAPRRFSISSRLDGVENVLHADLQLLADQNGIPCIVLRSRMTDPEIVEAMEAWCPDLMVVVGWYHMIPKRIREFAPVFGLHASLLPDYSGGAPLVWAMINGEPRTGITLFMLDGGIDSGPIVAQKEQPIYPSDTIANLYGRIEEDGLLLLEEFLPRIAMGSAPLQPQDESRRRVMPQRSPKDGWIDWLAPAQQVHDFVRAQSKPYPGAFAFLEHERLTIWDVCFGESQTSRRLPGEIWKEDGEVHVMCGDGRFVVLGLVSFGGDELGAQELYLRPREQRLGVWPAISDQ